MMARAADPAVSPVRLLQAGLSGSLDVSRLKEGTRIAARVEESWKGADCRLQRGALVEGRIVQVSRRSKTEKGSSFQVLFDTAACNGIPSPPLALTLIALIGPFGEAPNGAGLSEGAPLADAPGIQVGVRTGTQEAAAHGQSGYLRSVEGAAYVNEYTQAVRMTRKLPTEILPGQVIDVPKTDLHVGTGLEGASVVAVNKGDARLEDRTTLIFVPSGTLHEVQHEVKTLLAASAAKPASAATASAVDSKTGPPEQPGAAAGAASSAEPPDETELCAADCNVLGSLATRDTKTTATVGTLPLSALGYAPHDKQRALSFNYETTLTYLDDHHLLCTFDPHVLRSRSRDGTEPLRRIRAVMIDPTIPKVLSESEWRVRGDEAYLWRYGDSQILVHMEHALRLYDSHLTLVRTIPVEGPVPWIASSPSGDHTAIAVVKRRFSLDEFHNLQMVGEKPDEDVEVRVYDRNWTLVSVSLRSVKAPVPVLSDAGELRVAKVGMGRWTISDYGWDKSDHKLATVRSVCRPLLSAPAADLTFVTGCMGTTGNVWYRMLRPDGHALMKAESTADEIVQSSEGAPGGLFAIRVLKAAKPVTVDQPFNRDDLLKEEIGIYRSGNGARVGSVVTDDFILAEQSYALSPQGTQMAVAGKHALLFYALAPAH